MGKKTQFIIIISLVIGNSLFGQKKYMQSDDGKIFDSIAYINLKNKRTEWLNKATPLVGMTFKINEKLKVLRKNTDSIIYTYEWDEDFSLPKTIQLKLPDDGKYAIGDTFKMPRLTTIDNKSILLSDLKGRPSLITFWFISCKPCVEEMPALNRIKNLLKDSVNFIAITFDSKEKVENFLKKYEFNFTHIVNAQSLIDLMKISSFPRNVFLDKNGVIKKIEHGIKNKVDSEEQEQAGDGKEFLEYLQKLLQPT